MLRHLNMFEKADIIENALLYVIENGIHTKDLYIEGKSTKLVSTTEFGEEIAKNLGKKPKVLSSNSEIKHEDKKIGRAINIDNICAENTKRFSWC